MTCIVGIVKGNTVWLGGDSAATNQNMDRSIIKDPKVFVRGELAFGVCGLPKVMDAVAHVIELPEQQPGTTDRAFMAGELVPVIRKGLKKLDCTAKHPQFGLVFTGGMLIGYRGRLYELQGNFQLCSTANGWASIGSGSPFAQGALHASKGKGSPRKRILEALECATKGNAGVAPPYVIVSVKKKGTWR